MKTAHGTVQGNYYVTWREKRHIFRKYNSFGISSSQLEIAAGLGAKQVLVIFQGDDETNYFVASLDDWLGCEYEYTNDEDDVQKHLPLGRMDEVSKEFVKQETGLE